MTQPLWEELSDLADRLACAGQVATKDLRTIRAASVQMENWFIANSELREENGDAIKRVQEQDDALRSLADVFFHAGKFARGEITMDAFADGTKDMAPFRNIMAGMYGLNPVGGAPPAKRARKVKEPTP